MKGRKGRTRGLILKAVAVAMALSLMPAAAALADEGDQSWVAPSSKTPTTFVQDGKTYKYITSATRKVSESTADVLGISNVTVCPTAGNGFTYQGTSADIYNSIKTNARFGIYGSEVNENMNPYYANYFYHHYQQATQGENADAVDPLEMVLVDQGLNPGGPNAAFTTESDQYGTSPTLYYRPDILYGVSSLVDADGNALSYGQATLTTSGYSTLVEKIRNKELQGKEYQGVSLYREGDESYDPYYVIYNMTGYTTGIVDNLYSLAHAATNIMADTAGTNNPKVTRYEDPLVIAGNYEAYLQGTQLAVLAAIDGDAVERKTVGIVRAADVESGEVTFFQDKKGANYNADFTEFLAATTDNICDKNNLEVQTAPNNGPTIGIGNAQDLMDCDVVYIYGYNGMSNGNTQAQETIKDNLITILQNAHFEDEAAYPEINVATPKTVLHHDRGGSVENTVLLGSLVGFAYPEVVNPVHSLAYFYKNFYHIKSGSLQQALGMNLSIMTLPKATVADGLSLDSYDEDAYNSMLESGIAYYVDNHDAIDAAYPQLALTSELAEYAAVAQPYKEALNQIAVEAVVAKIDAIGDVTTASGNAIAAARAAVRVLTPAQLALVPQASLDTLQAAEANYNQAVVDGVVAQINAIGDVTTASGDTIAKARAALKALTPAQQALVPQAALDALQAAEAAYDQAVADGVVAQINAIGNVTANSGDAIAAARAAYEALTPAQQALVPKASLDALQAAEAAYSQATAPKTKSSQTISAKAKVTKSFKGKKGKLAKKKTIDLKKLAKVSAKTPVTYTKANSAGKSKIAVNKTTGKITLKKGLKKKTYKVKVKLNAAANDSFNAAPEKQITVVIKVK